MSCYLNWLVLLFLPDEVDWVAFVEYANRWNQNSQFPPNSSRICLELFQVRYQIWLLCLRHLHLQFRQHQFGLHICRNDASPCLEHSLAEVTRTYFCVDLVLDMVWLETAHVIFIHA